MLKNDEFKVELVEYPTADDWMEVKRRTLVTIGKMAKNPPTDAQSYQKAVLQFLHGSPLLGFRAFLPTHPRTALRADAAQ